MPVQMGAKQGGKARQKGTKMKTFTRPRQGATYDLAKSLLKPLARAAAYETRGDFALAGERRERGDEGSGLLVVVLFWRLQIVSHESFESYESNEFNSIELSSKRSLSFRLSPNSNEGRCQPEKEVHDDDNDDDDADDDDANEILL